MPQTKMLLILNVFPDISENVLSFYQRYNGKAKSGNTEHGKCWLMNEYLFFLFFIGHWYYEKNILFL
jgi:hypothetical protein